ncbi:MAG: alpha/beta hydrolase fold [Frankiales bacterium]|nr:alpha/beta hydrolase fold [Frankiales bacterium]
MEDAVHEQARIAVTTGRRASWLTFTGTLLAVTLAACTSSSARHGGPVTAAAADTVPGTRATGTAAFLDVVHRVRVGDVSLGYRQFGRGAPLVLIAGQSSGMNTWSVALPQRLAQRFRVTMFDARGVGYSTDNARDTLTIQLMADDTAGLLHALHITRASVLGWSTGGEIALALAVRHPDLVSALVLSGATAGGPKAIQASPAIDALVSSGRLQDEARLLSEFLFTPSGSAAMRDYVNGYLEVPEGTVSPEIMRRQAAAEQAFAASTDVYDALPRIKARTLVTNGALDQLVPPGNARLISSRLPHAQLAIFAGAAHAMMFQKMDRFVALVDSFLGSSG